jgi:hypothetical protein
LGIEQPFGVLNDWLRNTGKNETKLKLGISCFKTIGSRMKYPSDSFADIARLEKEIKDVDEEINKLAKKRWSLNKQLEGCRNIVKHYISGEMGKFVRNEKD